MTVDARVARASAQASWLAASGIAIVTVAVANAAADNDRWWANFILLPGAGLMAAAVLLLRGGRAGAGYAVLCVGALISTVGLLLLFEAMGHGWPLMIIIPCLAIAGTARWRAPDPNARAAHRTVVGLALLGALLGVTFLALGGGLIDLDGRWWAFFMMAAGLIAVGNGLSLLTDVRGYRLPTAVLLAGIGTATIFAGLRELLWR
jgi:hypothetical protein